MSSSAPHPAGPPSAVGHVLDGAYQLTRVIFEGGMGTVYEAVQLHLHKRVAVKIMVPELAENLEALGRFRREVEITSQLAHPHVCQLLDAGATPTGQPYLVMEYLDGEDLEHRLRRVGRLSLSTVTDLVRQIGSALSVIHGKGIVHRDLKAANVFLLTLDGIGDFAKVVDFGISKVQAARTQLTRDYTMVGTPEGMSPEQATARPDDVDHRTDQWALACLIWRMLSGTLPFQGATLRDLLAQIVHEEPPPLSAAVPGVPAPVEAVLRRALAKQKDDRFPTIGAFARAFETAAAPPAVVAAVPPPVGVAPMPAPVAVAPMAMTLPPELRMPPPSLTLPPARTPSRSWRWLMVVMALVALSTGAAVAYRNGGLERVRVLIEQAGK
jgi:eukaryotic-like serine/threonine-protein kinase